MLGFIQSDSGQPGAPRENLNFSVIENYLVIEIEAKPSLFPLQCYFAYFIIYLVNAYTIIY